MTPTWPTVWAEHQRNVGFLEGAGNRNPWTEEMGAGDAAYCVAAATIVPHHNGVEWWPDAQFGAKGYAYCPYARVGADKHGCWRYDRTSAGAPCDLLPGDIVLFDWGHDGIADHAETVVAVYADLTFDTVGYNTGSPEGCHFPVRRDRKYLLGRIRMQGTFYGAVQIPPAVPVPPFPPPTHYGDAMTRNPFNIPVGTDGKGWVQSDFPFDRVVSILVQGPFESESKPIPKPGSQNRDGKAHLSIEGAPPAAGAPYLFPIVVWTAD